MVKCFFKQAIGQLIQVTHNKKSHSPMERGWLVCVPNFTIKVQSIAVGTATLF